MSQKCSGSSLFDWRSAVLFSDLPREGILR
jgi:hypothetical protein